MSTLDSNTQGNQAINTKCAVAHQSSCLSTRSLQAHMQRSDSQNTAQSCRASALLELAQSAHSDDGFASPPARRQAPGIARHAEQDSRTDFSMSQSCIRRKKNLGLKRTWVP
eukprot:1152918-Amphidinium_carterae.1